MRAWPPTTFALISRPVLREAEGRRGEGHLGRLDVHNILDLVPRRLDVHNILDLVPRDNLKPSDSHQPDS